MAIIRSFAPQGLLSHDDDPSWKVVRYPFEGVGTEVIGVMQPGYLLKFKTSNFDKIVQPALAADDANLIGVIVGLPLDTDDPAWPTVAVALQGSFNQHQIHYADAWKTPLDTPPTQISATGIAALMARNIYLDRVVAATQIRPYPPPVPAIISPLTDTVVHAQPYTYTIVASNHADTYQAANLPAGLTLSGNVISGTAPAAGTYTIGLTATNAGGVGASSNLVLTVT